MLKASQNMATSLAQLEEIADNGMNLALEGSKQSKALSKKILMILMIGAVLLAVLLGFIVLKAVQSIVQPITRSISSLSQTSEQVSSASSQVA